LAKRKDAERFVFRHENCRFLSQPLHLPIIEQLTRDRLLPYNLVGLTLLQQIKFFVLAVSAIGLVASVV